MDAVHMNMLFPQWQGGGQDLSTYEGAIELKDMYLNDVKLSYVNVNTHIAGKEKHGIVGYDDILAQLSEAKNLIMDTEPNTLFTIGGGCDADIVAISYMNRLMQGDMALLYFDAHGDLNTPTSSVSKHFYGMAVRTLLGDGDVEVRNKLFSQLIHSQVVMAGIRELDSEESEYIHHNNIQVVSVSDIDKHSGNVMKALADTGKGHVYIHIDLDVLNPKEFPHVPMPVENGIRNESLLNALATIQDTYDIVGMGIFEYKPSQDADIPLLREIINIGINLSNDKLI
jgi:arginase